MTAPIYPEESPNPRRGAITAPHGGGSSSSTRFRDKETLRPEFIPTKFLAPCRGAMGIAGGAVDSFSRAAERSARGRSARSGHSLTIGSGEVGQILRIGLPTI